MEKVLIVDRFPIEARMAATLLSKAGFATALVSPGQDIVQAAEEQRPDVILLSVALAPEDGYRVCQQLKTNRATRSAMVVLYTVRGEPLDFFRGLEVGADDFLLTPVTNQETPARLKEILADRHMTFPGFSEPLDLVLTQIASATGPLPRRIERMLQAFTQHARKGINIMLSDYLGDILVNQAIEQTNSRYPFFGKLMHAFASGASVDSSLSDAVSVNEATQAFRTFVHALYRLVAIITRTRPNRVQEMRVIGRAFDQMLTDLQAQSEEYQRAAERTSEKPPTKEKPPAKGETATPLPATVSPSGQSTHAPALTLDCLMDARGHLILCHEGLARMLGYGRDELIGQPLVALLAGDGQHTLDKILSSLMTEGVARTYLHLKTKDGASIYAEAQFTAAYDANGQLVKAHGALRILSVSLVIQEQVAENEYLRRTLNELREQFTLLSSLLARDLNQPLGEILSLCDTLVTEHAGQLNELAQARLHKMQQMLLTAKQLTQGLTDYVQVSATPSSNTQVNLDQLIEEVRAALSLTLIQRRAVFRVTGELPTVVCDRERIRWLFTELATNALKFNKAISPTVEIGVQTDDPTVYTFYVKDNGIGIDVRLHESIFEPLYRAPQAQDYGGIGMGLATCQRIVQSHGGRLWVESRLGDGATFFFTLPR